VTSGYLNERPTAFPALPALELFDRFGRQQVLERGEEELIPVLSTRLQLL